MLGLGKRFLGDREVHAVPKLPTDMKRQSHVAYVK
jgi:hypothetical protein